MNAITACAAGCEAVILNRAVQMVWSVKKSSIPIHEAMNSLRRPARSQKKDAPRAHARFQIWRMPLIRSWIVVFVIPIVSNTACR